MRTLVRDVRCGLRALAETPGVTAVVILSLALGIGANTAIFTLIDAVMLTALPVREPEQLVLYGDGSSRGIMTGLSGRWNIFPYPLYERLREDNQSFVGVCAFRTQLDRLSVRPEGSAGGEPAQLAWGRLVSGNYFSILGVQAALGRTLTPDDDRPEAPPAAVMSYDYWKRRFNLARSAVGQALNVNGTLFTVVGVTPAEFFGESLEVELADIWLPMTLQPRVMQRESFLKNPEINWIHLIGRLKPGVRTEQAQAGVNVIFQQFLRQQAGSRLTPERERELGQSRIVLTPGGAGVSALRSRYSRPLRILLVVVALVLVIACANVANVLLSRAAAREKEISMRLALGASRARLIRQLLTESALLASLGGALGLVFAAWGVRVLVATVSTGSRIVPLNVNPDARILGFTLAVSLLTGFLFGLAPALRATKVELAFALKGGGAGTSGRPRRGLMKSLVVAQVALSLPLLVGAGLFLRTFERLHNQDLGFNRDRTLEVGIDPRIAGYQPEQLDSLYQALLERANRLPGVRVASLSLYSPMSGTNWSGSISVEGYVPPPKKPAGSQWVWVGPRYVETLGMTLLLGRDIGPRDVRGGPKVAVVNETFVRRYLADQSPIGRRFAMGAAAKSHDIEIVGVVKDFKFNDPRQSVWPVAFLPLVQSEMPSARYAAYLEVRTIGDPASAAGAVHQALHEVDKNLPVTGIKTLRRQVEGSLNRERLVASLSSFFGLLALLLACLGLYGVLAYAVSCRFREIGIRMALGACQANVLRMVLREAFCLVLIGAGIGLLAALAVSRFVSSQLYGLKPSDPLTMVTATLVLTAAAALAGYLPARRASRVDPMATLRAE